MKGEIDYNSTESMGNFLYSTHEDVYCYFDSLEEMSVLKVQVCAARFRAIFFLQKSLRESGWFYLGGVRHVGENAEKLLELMTNQATLYFDGLEVEGMPPFNIL